jgi:toxin HigB-1
MICVILILVIKTFRGRDTERLFASGVSRRFQKCARQAFQKLRMLDAAGTLADLGVLPGNRLEALKGGRAGQHSIRINDQYRICFGWRDGNAYNVEVTDYH